tara:strand:+ start:341 stop:505 length:165 start_codon:yes stop_codon:yes gene_type:complete
MTKKQKKEMINFFREMDAKIEAKEEKQKILAEQNPHFPTTKSSKKESGELVNAF